MSLRFPSFALLTLYVLSLAAALGLGSAHLATAGRYPFGGIRVGPWTAWPRTGSRDADPYARAINARSADIPLGAGEGLMLAARTDDEGRPLDSACVYRFAGETPPARMWTLTLYDGAGRLVASELGRSGFTSAEVLRDANGRFTVTAAREAQSGNWLPMPGSGRVNAVLRLYDTPASASSAALERRLLPTIERLACAS